jgi:hypothetical protein
MYSKTLGSKFNKVLREAKPNTTSLNLSMCKETVKGIFIHPIKVTQSKSNLLVCLGRHGYMMDLQINFMVWFGRTNFAS